MKVNIESIHFDADQKLIISIEEQAKKLTTYFDRILEINIILKLESNTKVKEKHIEVRAKVPGSLLISNATDKSFETALPKVFDIMKRNLVRHKEIITSH